MERLRREIYFGVWEDRMKIAMISEWRDPIYGWGQIHVKYLCEWLVKDHWCFVDLFVRKLKDNDWKSYKNNESFLSWKRNIIRTWWASDFFSLPYRIIWLCQITWTLYWATKKKKYDFIHWHALLPWLPIKIVSLLTWVPCVYTVHGTMLLDAKRRNLFYYIEYFLTCLIPYTLLISVSNNIFQYHPASKKVEIIYNGVDLEKISKIKVNQKYEKLTFLTVWRMDWQKNHIIILEALQKIKNDISDTKVQFIRVGDGSEMNNLQEKTKEYWLEKYIIFKWKLEYDKTLQEFKESHVFLLPSLGEGQPLTVLEAFACGLPVIATDVGDNKYFIESHSNGLLIKAWSCEEIASAILQYISSSSVKLHQESIQVKAIAQDYDRSKMVNNTHSYYKDILK